MSPDDMTTRELAAWEIISVTLSLLLLIWVVLPLGNYHKGVGAAFGAVCGAFMFLSHRRHGETLRDVGWRVDNFFAALRPVALLSAALAVPLLCAGWMLAGAEGIFNRASFERFVGNDDVRASDGARALWRLAMIFSGLAQQYVMQGFINRRAQMIFGRGGASILTVGAIFALLHLPNTWLALAALAEGLAWAWIFQRTPNLFALALSHAVMTRLTIALMPDHIIQGLRVGFKYLN